MKGWKKIVKSALQNAQMSNAFKDKPSGKEYRGRPQDAPNYRVAHMENLLVVLPANISEKNRSRVEKNLFPSR